MPKISVIMPVYGVEPFIAKSIRSVLNQTFSDFELLIVNDASPDRSVEIAMSFKDSRIRIFEKEHGGLSDTRNYGLERATGEFIYFMDSDDYIEPDLLEKNLEFITDNRGDFSVFGYWEEHWNERGEMWKIKEICPEILAFKRDDSHLKIDGFHLGLLGYAWNKLYKRTFIGNTRFRTGVSLIEDILFNLELFEKTNRIPFCRNSFYHYVNRNRETLINKFRINSFELIKEKTLAVAHFCETWGITLHRELLGEAMARGISYCLFNLYICQNTLSVEEKEHYVLNILTDQETRKLIKFFCPENGWERRYKKSIEQLDIDEIKTLTLTAH